MTSFRTNQILSEHLQLTAPRWNDDLDEIGGMTGRLPRGNPAIGALEDLPWRVIIWPSKGGNPQGAYVVTDIGAETRGNPTRAFTAKRVDEVFQNRLIRKTLDFTLAEQNNIARDLYRHGAGLPTVYTDRVVQPDPDQVAYGQLPWWRMDGTIGNTFRTRLAIAGNDNDGYPGDAQKIVGVAVEQLTQLGATSTVKRGPEIRLAYSRDDSGFYVTAQFGTPTLGLPANQPAIVLEYPGANTTVVQDGYSGADLVTRAVTVGEAKADDPVKQKATGAASDTAGLASGLPLLERAWSESSVSDVATLNSKAAARLTGLAAVDKVTLDSRRQPGIGMWSLGDHAVLRAKYRGVTTDRVVRIVGHDITVTRDGEQVELQLAKALP